MSTSDPPTIRFGPNGSQDNLSTKTAKPLATLGCAMLVVMGLVALISSLTRNHNPESFSTIVGVPQPASVVILHGDVGGFWKHGSYLHFQIAPNQLDTVVAKVGYKLRDQNSFLWDLPGNRPTWWTPDSMGSGLIYYYQRLGAKQSRWMVTNHSRNEVYVIAPDQ